MASLALGRGNRKGRELQKIKKRLEAVADLPTNRTCADCPEAEPAWASFLVKVSANAGAENQEEAPGQDQQNEQRQLAVLCCAQCSSYHGELGTDTCVVKNINKLEEWSDKEVEALELAGGNTKVNKILEAKLCTSVYNKSVILEDPGEDATARQGFISHKYQQLSYLDWELYQAHLEIAARIKIHSSLIKASSNHGLRRCKTHDSTVTTLQVGEHLKKPKKLPRRCVSAGVDSDDPEPAYGLPNHLGVTKPRSKSSQNLVNKTRQRQGRICKKGMPKALSHKDLVSSSGADPHHGKASTNAKPAPRRHRRKSSGATPEARKANMRPSASTPCISRWGAGADDTGSQKSPPSCSRKTNRADRWNTSGPEPPLNNGSSKKNFTWNTNSNEKTDISNTVTDIAALREICIPKYCGASDEVLHGLAAGISCSQSGIRDDATCATASLSSSSNSPLRMPCRVVSDEDLSGRQSSDRSGIMVPSIADNANPRTSLSRALRMPSRVLSDDSSVESSNRTGAPADDISSTLPSTSKELAIQLLASRRSMPTLALSHLLPVVQQQQDEDSIRNPYGVRTNSIFSNSDSNLNFTYPVGRQRTCFDEPQAKYGIIKPKYGSEHSSDSNTDSSEGREKRSSSKAQRGNNVASTMRRLNSISEDLPTLGVFLQSQPEQPKRVLGERSVGTLSTGDDSDILGIGSMNIGKSSNEPKLTSTIKGTSSGVRPPRPPPSQAAPKQLSNNGKGGGGLWNHLNMKSGRTSPLKTLEELAGGNISVVSGFSFESEASDDSISVGKATKRSSAKSSLNNKMRRGASCSGLNSRSSFGLVFEDSFSSAGYSRSNRGTNAVW